MSTEKLIEAIDEIVKWIGDECYHKATLKHDNNLFDVYMEFDVKLQTLKRKISFGEYN